jgi:hypothetical protein
MLGHFANSAGKIPTVDPHKQRKTVRKITTRVADTTASFINIGKDSKAIPSTMNRARDMLPTPIYGIIQCRRQAGQNLFPAPSCVILDALCIVFVLHHRCLHGKPLTEPSETPLAGILGRSRLGRLEISARHGVTPTGILSPGGIHDAVCFLVASYHTFILRLMVLD